MADVALRDCLETFANTKLLNDLPESAVKDLCGDVIQDLLLDRIANDMNAIMNSFEQKELIVERKEAQALFNLVKNIYRSASVQNLLEEDLEAQLKSSSTLSPSVIKVITEFWKNERKQIILHRQESIKSVNIGQLVDLQWCIGMAMSSDSCRNLNFPYITLTLTIAELDQRLTVKSFDLSLSEFQKFHSQLKDMASILATV